MDELIHKLTYNVSPRLTYPHIIRQFMSLTIINTEHQLKQSK